MRTATHRRALIAAAHLTGLCVVISACKATTTGGEQLGTAPTSVPDAMVPAPPASTPTSVVEPEPKPARSCESVVKEAFNPEHGTRDGEPLLLDGFALDEVQACCQEVKDELDAKNEFGMGRRCCDLTDAPMSGACTPWGPPAPPVTHHEQSRFTEPRMLRVARVSARLDGLEPPQNARTRATAIETWRGRMLNETVSARVFDRLAEQMRDAGFASQEVEIWAGFAREERRHGALCATAVVALGGDPSRQVPSLPQVPEHPHLRPRARVLCNVLSVSALSETVAVALIDAERQEMPQGPLRDVLTEILADEVGHARAGWRLLQRELERDPSLSADLEAYLPVALEALVEHELQHLPVGDDVPEDGARYGLCSGAKARALLFDTVERVIKPALDLLLARPLAA